jgi:rifampin ADP-ribosylating transferase
LIEDKLIWDLLALELACKIDENSIGSCLPSLYLNIAKDYEDLNNIVEASKNYQLALNLTEKLPDNGYGKMIRAGIENGIDRIAKV